MKFLLLVAALTVAFPKPSLNAMYAQPETVPADRLIQTGEEALRANPNSVEAIYMLARTHYLAFACGAKQLDAYRDADNGLFTVGPFVHFPEPAASQIMNEARRRALAEMNIELGSIPTLETPMGGEYGKRLQEIKKQLEKSNWRPAGLPEGAALDHITQAARYFKEAQRLAPDNGLYHLGYASLLEETYQWVKQHLNAAIPEVVGQITPASIRAEYRRAWEMALPADLKDKERGTLDL